MKELAETNISSIFRNLNTKSFEVGSENTILPYEFSKNIIESINYNSIMRQLIKPINISTTSVEILSESDECIAEFVEEKKESKQETKHVLLEKKKIDTHELRAVIHLTSRFAQDISINISEYLKERVSFGMSKSEDIKFLFGTGNNEPLGLLTKAEIQKITETKNILQILIECFYKLPSDYTYDSVWIISSVAYTILLKNQSTTIGFNFSAKQSMTILGRPVYITSLLKDIDIVLVNPNKEYKIVDRSDIELLIDPYSVHPYIKYIFTKRVGGMPVLSKQLLQCFKIT